MKEGGGGGFLAFYTSTGAFYTSTGEMTTCHFIFRQCFNHYFRLNKYSARDRLFGKISPSNFKLEFHFYWREAHVKATEILVEKIQRELLTFNPLIDEHPSTHHKHTHTHTHSTTSKSSVPFEPQRFMSKEEFIRKIYFV